jgi:hypothetical protein
MYINNYDRIFVLVSSSNQISVFISYRTKYFVVVIQKIALYYSIKN